MHEKITELGSAIFAVIHQITAAYRFAVGLLELVGEVMDLLCDQGGDVDPLRDVPSLQARVPPGTE